MVACWPVPKARLASISKLIRVGIGRAGRGVDGEAAGADRLKPRLAHRHPIGFAKLLEPGRAVAERGHRADLIGGRRMLEIGMDQPVVGPGFIGFVGDQHRGTFGEGRELAHRADLLALGAVARDRDSPAHRT